MNLLTMTEKELIEHASKQVQALRMALDMIECEKYERRHVRWAIIDALKEEDAAQPADQGQSCYCPNCEALSKQLAAQRQWVGLTDEEIYEIGFNTNIGGVQILKAYKAIEAKIKEKA